MPPRRKRSRPGRECCKNRKIRVTGLLIKTGIVAAEYDTIVIIDADGTYPPDQIPHLVSKLETADMVVGARTGTDVHIPWVRRPAKWLLGLLANRVSGQSIPDLNSGLRTFRRDCVRQYFSILSDKFSFTTTVTLALLADDYRVVYHPINYYRRLGKSKVTPRNFVDFTILVLRMAMLISAIENIRALGIHLQFVGCVQSHRRYRDGVFTHARLSTSRLCSSPCCQSPRCSCCWGGYTFC